MRDVKLLRTALDGRIPEVTANGEEPAANFAKEM